MSKQFSLAPDTFPPRGDQPTAIEDLVEGLRRGKRIQTLLGVTGSGKTFTVANVVARTNKNTLVISHNKTLAAQLYSEFKQFFPNNNVGYFVSFYDYYQPESYLPQTDTYIEKDTEVNEKIEKMRLEATAMLMSGEPTIIVSTVSSIRRELETWLPNLPGELERQRLNSRTNYDLEMIQELGYCSGIENYSRHFDGRMPGQPPYCLLDFFGNDFLLVIDESHVTLPQLRGMYQGDYTRKKSLVDYGFRLPSAFDNRPLKFAEFEKYLKPVVFVSATPADYERKNSSAIVEQLVRPTGLVDPKVEVRPTQNQINDLIDEIRSHVQKNQRTLVTTLTKRMAEDLAEYLAKKEVRVRYMHSEIEGLERTELIRQLRIGEFDVLVGINLLREGLDIPEVGLVAILDADKEGFLRNTTSLVQTFGRASRNIDGTVIMYADNITQSMKEAITETERRRKKQILYNQKHGITPKTIVKAVAKREDDAGINVEIKSMSSNDLSKLSIEIETNMKRYAEDLDFEKAIQLRDQLTKIKKVLDSQLVNFRSEEHTSELQSPCNLVC